MVRRLVWRNGAKIASVGSDIVARVGAANGVDELPVESGGDWSYMFLELSHASMVLEAAYCNAYAPKLVPDSVDAPRAGLTWKRRAWLPTCSSEPLEEESRFMPPSKHI
jgi:hypothetical protein